MKKLSAVMLVLIPLTACAFNEHDSDFPECEKIAETEQHLVYKCPANQERFEQVKQSTPNAMFRYNLDEQDILISELSKDTDHIYVEVVLNDASGCKEDFHYRTIIKPVNGDDFYAVESCK